MAAVVPVLATLGGSSALIGATTALSVGSTLFGGIASAQSGRYQSALLQRQALAEARNADRAVFAGQQTQQDQDAAAVAQQGAETAGMAASGFSLNSASFVRRQELNKLLARRDAQRIRYDADVQAQNIRANAATLRAEAGAARFSAMDALALGLNVGSDLLTGAAMVNRNKANQIRRDSVGVY